MPITISGNITINQPVNTVFNFVANLQNDKRWRKEINGTTMQGPPQVGALATEDSFLSKRQPHHVLQLVCTAYQANGLVVYSTAPGQPFSLKSTRQVQATGNGHTLFTYRVEFDKAIVKHGLGFSLPEWLITLAAKSDMHKYLKKLKQVLEAE